MISKKYIKDLDFETIEDIYKYIVDSEINGAISQFKELINKLSKEQFKDFLAYIDDFVYLNENHEEQHKFKNKVINARGF
jgi:hypothetical protein